MKKAVALCLVLLLCGTMILSASADAFIPADENCNYNLMFSPYEDGECYALNIFLSNYAETQLKFYEPGSGSGDAYFALLKHFELNPNAYKEGTVTSFTGHDGKTYMRIKGEKFESRMKELFGIRNEVEGWPGYYDGDIVVSAENFGAPIQVFASARNCEYLGNYRYVVRFDVYRYEGDVSKKYAVANNNLGSGCELISTGVAQFYYYGDRDETEFHSYDFSLAMYSLSEGYQLPPYGNENKPYVEPVAEVTEAPTENTVEVSTQEAEEETHENTAQSSAEETMPTEAPTAESVKENLEPLVGKTRPSLALVLSLGVVAIIVMTLIPLVIILVVTHRKKP